MIDRNVDQTAAAVDDRLENHVVSDGDHGRAELSLGIGRIEGDVPGEVRVGQHAAFAYGAADFVERNPPDQPVLVVDDEARTQAVIETFLDGDKNVVCTPADKRLHFVGADWR